MGTITHKLMPDEAMEIYNQYRNKIPPTIIAEQFGIHRTMVYSIGKKETWKWIHDSERWENYQKNVRREGKKHLD